jgi:hypothetical protein
MARVVDELAARTPGKRSLAMAAFARALRQIPTIICDNAGEQLLDWRQGGPAGVVVEQRAASCQGWRGWVGGWAGEGYPWGQQQPLLRQGAVALGCCFMPSCCCCMAPTLLPGL